MNCTFKKKNNVFEFVRHVSIETAVIVSCKIVLNLNNVFGVSDNDIIASVVFKYVIWVIFNKDHNSSKSQLLLPHCKSCRTQAISEDISSCKNDEY